MRMRMKDKMPSKTVCVNKEAFENCAGEQHKQPSKTAYTKRTSKGANVMNKNCTCEQHQEAYASDVRSKSVFLQTITSYSLHRYDSDQAKSTGTLGQVAFSLIQEQP